MDDATSQRPTWTFSLSNPSLSPFSLSPKLSPFSGKLSAWLRLIENNYRERRPYRALRISPLSFILLSPCANDLVETTFLVCLPGLPLLPPTQPRSSGGVVTRLQGLMRLISCLELYIYIFIQYSETISDIRRPTILLRRRHISLRRSLFLLPYCPSPPS